MFILNRRKTFAGDILVSSPVVNPSLCWTFGRNVSRSPKISPGQEF